MPTTWPKCWTARGVAVRAGHHCAMPLHKRLWRFGHGPRSFYFYNTLAEVQQLGPRWKRSNGCSTASGNCRERTPCHSVKRRHAWHHGTARRSVGWLEGYQRAAVVGEPHHNFRRNWWGSLPLDPPYGLVQQCGAKRRFALLGESAVAPNAKRHPEHSEGFGPFHTSNKILAASE